jgi:oligopeptide/dipeptide ABC transporter ATP-binding protein
MDALLSVEDLRVEIRSERGRFSAVAGIDFELGRGEAIAFVGESGCGKTMTARALMRLLPRAARVSGGRIVLEGTDILRLSERGMRGVRGARIGMTFQDPATYINPTLRVGRQVAEVVRRHRPDLDAKARVEELFELTQLPEPRRIAQMYPHELSGGMRQRVLLAAALGAGPSVLIADEPTTALDVTIQAQILELLSGLRRELDLSVILISHDLAVVSELADRVYVMYAGRILEAASSTAFFGQRMHPYSMGLLAATRTVHDERAILDVLPGDVPDPMNLPEGCKFAPRCPYRFERCVAEPPLFVVGSEAGGTSAGEVGVGSVGTVAVRCWLHCPDGAGSGCDSAAVNRRGSR